MSDRAIARTVNVSPTTVGKVRKTMKQSATCPMDTKDTTTDLSNYPFLLAHKAELSELSLKSKQVMKSVEVLNLMEQRKSLSPRYCARLLNQAKKNSRRFNPDRSVPKVIIKCADIKNGLDFVEDESVDIIITDLMYDRKSIENTYSYISEICGRCLKDGGSALIMVGQSHLPLALSALTSDKRLRYHWCLSVVLPRQSPALQWLHVSPHFKLVLHFVKGSSYKGDLYSDIIISKDLPDKSKLYEWQQDQFIFDELARRFIQHNDTVLLDMCAGSATSLIAGLRTGLCKTVIGVDCDKKAISIAKKRINEELQLSDK